MSRKEKLDFYASKQETFMPGTKLYWHLAPTHKVMIHDGRAVLINSLPYIQKPASQSVVGPSLCCEDWDYIGFLEHTLFVCIIPL